MDLSDLATLLSNFGTSSGATRAQGDVFPITGDGSIGLGDLAELLAFFGATCANLCSTPSPLTGSVTISVAAFDTGSYAVGDFDGEKWDFVFDLLTTMNTGADDWVGSGCEISRANGATFRLVPSAGNPPVPTSSLPNKYATFFSVPYAVDTNSRFNTPFPSGGIAGEYDVTSTAYSYSATLIDASWYDLSASSNDGPAAVLRLVIDVSGVTGANTSGGFGSVYFTSGSPGSGDIKVADLIFEVAHKYDTSGSATLSGSFYVTD